MNFVEKQINEIKEDVRFITKEKGISWMHNHTSRTMKLGTLLMALNIGGACVMTEFTHSPNSVVAELNTNASPDIADSCNVLQETFYTPNSPWELSTSAGKILARCTEIAHTGE